MTDDQEKRRAAARAYSKHKWATDQAFRAACRERVRRNRPAAAAKRRAREAAVIRALAAADRLAEACIHAGPAHSWCDVCGQAWERATQKHDPTCLVAAYLAAREETR